MLIKCMTISGNIDLGDDIFNEELISGSLDSVEVKYNAAVELIIPFATEVLPDHLILILQEVESSSRLQSKYGLCS